MENKNTLKEKKFDSFLTKTIIFSSKDYYRTEITKDKNELKIIDDENYTKYLNDYLKYSFDDTYEKVTNFMDVCDNTMLIEALKSLSDIEMAVIFLLFEKQLTSSESSKILKICADTVTRIKKRALRKLKNYLEGGDLDE